MNIVVITDIGVDVYKKWKDVQTYTGFKKEEFTPIGKDYFLNIDSESYEIQKDIKLLERVASEKVFSKNKLELTDWTSIFTLILALLIYIK